jgi:hypothetical protein
MSLVIGDPHSDKRKFGSILIVRGRVLELIGGVPNDSKPDHELVVVGCSPRSIIFLTSCQRNGATNSASLFLRERRRSRVLGRLSCT